MNRVWPRDDAQEGVPERGCNVEMGFWWWRGPAALLGNTHTPPQGPLHGFRALWGSLGSFG